MGMVDTFLKQVFVSNTLLEDYVGLEEVDDGVYDLFYCFYHIGRYEFKTNKMHDIVSKVGLSVRRADRVSRASTMSPVCTSPLRTRDLRQLEAVMR